MSKDLKNNATQAEQAAAERQAKKDEKASGGELSVSLNRILNAAESCADNKLTPIVISVNARCQELEITEAKSHEFAGRNKERPGTVNARSYAAEVDRVADPTDKKGKVKDEGFAKRYIENLASVLEQRGLTIEYFEPDAEAEDK